VGGEEEEGCCEGESERLTARLLLLGAAADLTMLDSFHWCGQRIECYCRASSSHILLPESEPRPNFEPSRTGT
jgi:hypothetical protein